MLSTISCQAQKPIEGGPVLPSPLHQFLMVKVVDRCVRDHFVIFRGSGTFWVGRQHAIYLFFFKSNDFEPDDFIADMNNEPTHYVMVRRTM